MAVLGGVTVCVILAVLRIARQAGAPAFDFACTLADVGNICSVSEQGKSKEETEACEAELKKYCKLKMVDGPPCVTCVKEHLQRIDDGLVGDSMCSSFQLNQFCFFTGSIDGEKYPAGLEKLYKERGKKVPGELGKEARPEVPHWTQDPPASAISRASGRQTATSITNQLGHASTRSSVLVVMGVAAAFAAFGGLSICQTHQESVAIGLERKARSTVQPDGAHTGAHGVPEGAGLLSGQGQ